MREYINRLDEMHALASACQCIELTRQHGALECCAALKGTNLCTPPATVILESGQVLSSISKGGGSLKDNWNDRTRVTITSHHFHCEFLIIRNGTAAV